jgi:hypothetical protein
MTWLKLDDQFSDHPKVVAAGPAAMWLFVCGLCYCGRHLTDGRIPKAMLPRLADVKSPTRLAARLVEVELWHDDGDHFLVHHFLVHNPSRANVEKQRADNRDRQKRSRSRRESQRDEDVTDGVTHSAPTRPDPSRPLPTDAGKPEDDDSRAVGPLSSSKLDPHWEVWTGVGRLALAERADPPDNPTAYVTATARKARSEKRADLADFLEVRPDASNEDLARWLYEKLDPDLMRLSV